MSAAPKTYLCQPADWTDYNCDDDVTDVIRATSREQARYLHATGHGLPYVDVRVTRLPKLDGRPLTPYVLVMEAGFWYECHRCLREHVHDIDLAWWGELQGCVGRYGAVYCSEACLIAAEQRED